MFVSENAIKRLFFILTQVIRDLKDLKPQRDCQTNKKITEKNLSLDEETKKYKKKNEKNKKKEKRKLHEKCMKTWMSVWLKWQKCGFFIFCQLFSLVVKRNSKKLTVIESQKNRKGRKILWS